MGAKYSQGAYPPHFKDGLLKDLDINAVRLKVYLFERIKRGRFSKYQDLFITKNEVQYLFQFSPRQIHEFFQLLDHEQLRRIPVYDLWGCLTLACSNSANEKVEFMFELLDTNKDGFVSKNDLENMFVCATRGFARLKAIAPPPMANLKDLCKKAIYNKSTILNEKGEIAVIDLKVFVMSSDSCRKYFSNLGTNVELKDENKLLQQRADMLHELLEVEYEMKELERTEFIREEDVVAYARERGGDERLVRITESQLARLGTMEDKTNEDFDDIRRALTAKSDAKADALEAQYNRRAHRENAADAEAMRLKDAIAFSPARHCRPAANNGHSSNVSDQAFLFRWNKLPQDADGLTSLDIDTIEDLFEASGILMTDLDAQKCLDTIRPNQLGRYSVDDVMRWHKDFVLWGSSKKPLFREVAELFTQELNSVGGRVSSVLKIMSVHKAYAAQCDEIKSKIKVLRDKIESAAEPLRTEEELELDNELEDERRRRPRLHRTGTPTQPGEKSKPGFQLNISKEQLVGSVRLAAWQRQQVLNPPSRIELKATFGMYTDAPVGVQRATAAHQKSPHARRGISSPSSGRSSPTGKNSSLTKKAVAAKAGLLRSPKKENKAEDTASVPHWKMNFKFQFSVKPLMDSRSNKASSTYFIDDDEYLLKNVYDFTSQDLLEHFTFTFKGLLGEMTKSFGTASWVVFEVSPLASDEEATLLNVCCRNFFESVPLQERQSYYTSVRTRLLTVKWEPGNEMSFPKSVNPDSPLGSPTGNNKSLPPKGTGVSRTDGLQSLWRSSLDDVPVDDFGFPVQRIVLVVLLHEDDVFRKLEDTLPPGILLTRTVREMQLEINLKNTLSELYQYAFPFDHYRDRLFGPQEDELGEEGMNPLRYAKLCRKRQMAAEEVISHAAEMNVDDLRYHCRVHGLSDSGTKTDLVQRVQMALRRQLDRLGFGELSAFGEDMCKKVFSRFKDLDAVDCGGGAGGSGLSLWELNAMLYEAGSEQSIYNLQEYKSMLQEYEFRSDKQGRILCEGLTAYFERFGRLGDCLQALAVGSLDEHLSGRMHLSVDFDNAGFASLVDMFSMNTVSEGTLKRLVRLLSCLQDTSVEADYLRPSHLLQAWKSFLRGCGLFGEDAADLSESIDNLLNCLLEYLKTPGWLASKLHRLLEELANGENGIVRSLRVFLMTEFSSYANWEGIFRDHIKSWRKQNSFPTPGAPRDNDSEVQTVHSMEEDVFVSGSNVFGPGAFIGNNDHERPDAFIGNNDHERPGTGRSGLTVDTSRGSNKGIVERGNGAVSVPDTARSSAVHRDPRDDHVEKLLSEAAVNQAAEAERKQAVDDEKQRIEDRHAEVRRLEEFLQKCLPELLPTNHLTEVKFEELMNKAKRLKELLANEHIHLNRAEREELRVASATIEAEAIKLRSDLEHCKSVSAAHACALYDAVRLYSKGLVSVGWGTKEICVKSTAKGFDWAELLPRAEGELSVPMQLQENKLRRAAQRKNAALAALEREQHRRKLDDADREKLKKENDNKKDKRVEEEERLLFAEAFDLYCIAKEERQLVPTLEKLASLWEKLVSLKTSRYPKSIQTIICQNNFACICIQFFGKTSVRWTDASLSFDICSELLYLLLEEMHLKSVEDARLQHEQELTADAILAAEDGSDVLVSPPPLVETASLSSKSVEFPVNGSEVLGQGRRTEAKVAYEKGPTSLLSARSNGGAARGSASDMGISTKLDISGLSGGQERSSSSRVGTGRPTVSSARELVQTENIITEQESRLHQFPNVVTGVPESLLSPIVIVLQNHLTYLRSIAPIDVEGRPRYEELSYKQRRAVDRNQSIIAALLELLSEQEKERVFNGISRSVNHIPVFVCMGSTNSNSNNANSNVTATVNQQLNLTVEENATKNFNSLRRAHEEQARQVEHARIAEQEAAIKAVEDEELARRERELKVAMAEESSMSTQCELALARDEKAKRYQKQRDLDKIVRDRVSKHRNKLYAMIRSDEISKVFKSHAKSVEAGSEYVVHWGKSQDEVLQKETFQRPGDPHQK
jgi:hypothetical protein